MKLEFIESDHVTSSNIAAMREQPLILLIFSLVGHLTMLLIESPKPEACCGSGSLELRIMQGAYCESSARLGFELKIFSILSQALQPLSYPIMLYH